MTGSANTLLAALERIPGVRLEIDEAQRAADVRVGARVIARIDLQHDHVVVDTPADLIPTVQRVFPSSRPVANGISFGLDGDQTRREALAAIRRRVNVERVATQFREASP
jgi:hypothetical protein